MKVYLRPQPGLSRAMDRVEQALMRSAPKTVTFVPRADDAEIVVLHVIGYPETVAAIARCHELGQRYAMIQYCFKTTQEPERDTWMPLWKDASVVWSYYNLSGIHRIDLGGLLSFGEAVNVSKYDGFKMYYAPLGVDTSVFRSGSNYRPYLVGCSGYVAESECLQEVADAAKPEGVFHLGHQLNLGPHVDSRLDVMDGVVAGYWGACQYVTGLRRIEGFELPLYEGLACGARPIAFDQPHYRHWLEDHAEYIPEGSAADVTAALKDIFTRPHRPVTTSERLWLEDRFNWGTIGRGFWERAL